MHVQAVAGTVAACLLASVSSYYIQYRIVKQIKKCMLEGEAQLIKANKRTNDVANAYIILAYALVSVFLVAAIVQRVSGTP